MRIRTIPQVAVGAFSLLTFLLPQQTRAQSAPPVGEGVCVEYCGSSSSSSSSRPTSWGETYEGRLYRWMKQKHQESQRRKAHELNDAGVNAYRQRRYAEAAKLFQKALGDNPHDITIQGNFQTATQALREAQAAAYHGANAARSSNIENAGGIARNVFDTRASAAPANSVYAGGSRQSPSWPDWINEDHKMTEFRKERDKWLQKENKLQAQLAQINEKESQGKGNKSNLQVQEAQVKDKLSGASYNKRVVENEMESYAIDLSRQGPPTKHNH